MTSLLPRLSLRETTFPGSVKVTSSSFALRLYASGTASDARTRASSFRVV